MLSSSQYTALKAITNCPGPTGATGPASTGATGATGSVGRTGATGATGSTGFGSEISSTFTVRALTTSPWFEWSVTGLDDWTPVANDAIRYGTFAALDTNTEIRGLIFNGSVWVCSVFVKTAVTTNFPQFLYSSDGKIWTPGTYIPVGTPPFGILNEIRGAYKIGWNGYMLVATGTSTNTSIAYSTDNGITWTSVPNSRTNIIQFGRGIAWNGKAWLLTGTSAVANKPIAYSLNGINWTPVTISNTLLDIGHSVATDGMRWVVGGNVSSAERRPIYSDDKTGAGGWNSTEGWTEHSNTLIVSDLSWNGRQWIALTAKDISKVSVLVSSLGGTWETTGQSGGIFDLGESVTWNSSAWLITGTSATPANRLKYSTDNGVAWTSITGRTASTSIASRTIVPLLNTFGDIDVGRNLTVNGNTTLAGSTKLTLGSALVMGTTGGGSRVEFQNTTAGSNTAFVSGNLNSNGVIIADTFTVTGTSDSRLNVGKNTVASGITRAGLGNSGNFLLTTAYVSGNLDSSGNILVSGAASQFGFTAGAGGTIVQGTSRGTDVLLNRPTGTIQVFSAILNANTSVNIPLVNNTIGPQDMVIVQHISGGTVGLYNITAIATASGATITMRNNTSVNSPNESPVLRFVVIKSANA